MAKVPSKGTARKRYYYIGEDRKKLCCCELDEIQQVMNKRKPSTFCVPTPCPPSPCLVEWCTDWEENVHGQRFHQTKSGTIFSTKDDKNNDNNTTMKF